MWLDPISYLRHPGAYVDILRCLTLRHAAETAGLFTNFGSIATCACGKSASTVSVIEVLGAIRAPQAEAMFDIVFASAANLLK